MRQEKRKQVVAATRCTDPEVNIASAMHNTASPHFVWKPWPKTNRSRFPKQVSRKTNRRDPRKPAAIVPPWLVISTGLSICIPLMVRMERTRETTQDAPIARAMLPIWWIVICYYRLKQLVLLNQSVGCFQNWVVSWASLLSPLSLFYTST